MNTIEVWKPIKNYEEFYEVSNYGNVRSIANRRCVHGIDTYSIRKKPLLMKFGHNQFGHLQVHLFKDKKRKTKLVHRLVAEAFIEKPQGKDYINHKDYNPKNNYYKNLEWCTQKENVNYSLPHMKHPRICKTNTGHHHITFRKSKGLYRVSFNKTEKTFKSLEKAIEFRNEVYEKYSTIN